MKKLLFIIIFSLPALSSAEMVILYLKTENTGLGIEPCEMIERGSAVKSSYYKFTAEPGSGGCHASIPKSTYYKNFKFCGIGSEKTTVSEYNRGECLIYPHGDSIAFSAMPGIGPRNKVYYNCTYVCETQDGYKPNYHKN